VTLLTKRGWLLAAASVVVLSGTAGRGVTASAADKVSEWDQIAEDTVLRAGAFQGEGFVYMGYVSAAVYDAAVAIDPRYEPYRAGVTAPAGASADAAVVEAAYRTLLHYFPAQSAQLDPRYAASLATIKDGPAKVAGQAVGQAAADLIVALRANDGVRTPVATTSDFPHRTPGPGVWRLTPPAFAAPQTPWLGGVTPFLVDDVERFRPDGPPSLDSFEWVEAYEEVKRYGGADSTVRTPAQSATALFWTANVIRQYNRAVRDVIQAESLRLTDAARLQAMVNMTGADALIGALNAKYHFLFWRPVTAIDPSSVETTPGDGFGPIPGYSDPNPFTIEQAGWRPFAGATPNHPEYPAAHGTITSAMAEVFSAFLDTNRLNLVLHGFDPAGAAGNLDAVRTYPRPAALREDVVNARVWAGFHYRFSAEAGVDLGRKIAKHALKDEFAPVRRKR
jgi:VCPO second helical-bundle domain